MWLWPALWIAAPRVTWWDMAGVSPGAAYRRALEAGEPRWTRGGSRGGSGCSRGGTGDPGNEMMVAAGGRRALMNVQQESPRGGGGEFVTETPAWRPSAVSSWCAWGAGTTMARFRLTSKTLAKNWSVSVLHGGGMVISADVLSLYLVIAQIARRWPSKKNKHCNYQQWALENILSLCGWEVRCFVSEIVSLAKSFINILYYYYVSPL